jgi:hypothetical protein
MRSRMACWARSASRSRLLNQRQGFLRWPLGRHTSIRQGVDISHSRSRIPFAPGETMHHQGRALSYRQLSRPSETARLSGSWRGPNRKHQCLFHCIAPTRPKPALCIAQQSAISPFSCHPLFALLLGWSLPSPVALTPTLLKEIQDRHPSHDDVSAGRVCCRFARFAIRQFVRHAFAKVRHLDHIDLNLGSIVPRLGRASVCSTSRHAKYPQLGRKCRPPSRRCASVGLSGNR